MSIDNTVLPTWTWPEERLQGLMNRARAGRSLRPSSWPGGARCAVALSFDSDHDTFELRDGGKSISALSQGHFGPRQGIPRIRQLLDANGIPATFFVPAITALHYPDEQRALVAEGHEIGLHGWIHERNTLLDEATERDLQYRAADTLEEVTGVRPVGIRTPSWDFSENTLKITTEMGLLYDSSLMADVGLLRAFARRLTDGRCRIAGRMDSRRRSLSGHGSLGRASSPDRTPRHTPHLRPGVRRGV